MNVRRIALRRLAGVVAGIATGFTALALIVETPRAAATNRASIFVGTWVATEPNESRPFLTLKLTERDGRFFGSISHFKIRVVGEGRIVGAPIPAAESRLSDVHVTGGEVQFTWNGDPPLRGGRAALVVQGTEVGYLLIPVTGDEMQKVVADSPGASGFTPIVWMRRYTEGRDRRKPQKRSDAWEVTTTARLVNASEFQYRLAFGTYVDYPTLVRSGQLRNTAMRQFTLVPRTLKSMTDPLPGYSLRLLVASDGRSYELSILEKAGADCLRGVFSDETGIVFDGLTAECSFGGTASH